MNAKERLINIFEQINDAKARCGEKYIDKDLDLFVNELRTGAFFELSDESQMSVLHWYDEAYLGKGDLITGLIHVGVLPKEFAIGMRISYLSYYLMLDIPEDRKECIRRQLAEILKE